jgi:DNA polymerase I-like protein with 3'-5' exonuclease and polymerase domains
MNLKKLIEEAIVFDLETTITHLPDGRFSPAPWYQSRPVAIGILEHVFIEPPLTPIYNSSWEGLVHASKNCSDPESYLVNMLRIADTIKHDDTEGLLLVGHNVKFDLAHGIYAMKRWGITEVNIKRILSRVHVWDTMIAEFYLTKQRVKSASLERCCELNGIPFTKDVTVSESFKVGVGADLMDKETLLEYLKDDVMSTSNLFKAQLKRALAEGGPSYVHYLIKLMGASVTTTQAECEGLILDTDLFKNEQKDIEERISKLESELNAQLIKVFDERSRLDPVISSPKMLSLFLFGGSYDIVESREELDSSGNTLLYKSGSKKGKPKTKRVKSKVEIVGRVPNKVLNHKFLRTKSKSTSSKYLKDILLVIAEDTMAISHKDLCDFINKILEYRRLAKDFSTYFGSLEKHVAYDGTLHATYNHSIAVTKRLTSSNPNFQNMSNKSGIDDGD